MNITKTRDGRNELLLKRALVMFYYGFRLNEVMNLHESVLDHLIRTANAMSPNR